MKICFDIAVNEVVEGGKEEMYLQIVGPDGKVLRNSNEPLTYIVGGSNTQCSTSKTFSYDKSVNNLCIYFKKGAQRFYKGDYKFKLFNKNALAGETTYSVK